jgi:hypothetical protein
MTLASAPAGCLVIRELPAIGSPWWRWERQPQMCVI